MPEVFMIFNSVNLVCDYYLICFSTNSYDWLPTRFFGHPHTVKPLQLTWLQTNNLHFTDIYVGLNIYLVRGGRNLLLCEEYISRVNSD